MKYARGVWWQAYLPQTGNALANVRSVIDLTGIAFFVELPVEVTL